MRREGDIWEWEEDSDIGCLKSRKKVWNNHFGNRKRKFIRVAEESPVICHKWWEQLAQPHAFLPPHSDIWGKQRVIGKFRVTRDEFLGKCDEWKEVQGNPGYEKRADDNEVPRNLNYEGEKRGREGGHGELEWIGHHRGHWAALPRHLFRTEELNPPANGSTYCLLRVYSCYSVLGKLSLAAKRCLTHSYTPILRATYIKTGSPLFQCGITLKDNARFGILSGIELTSPSTHPASFPSPIGVSAHSTPWYTFVHVSLHLRVCFLGSANFSSNPVEGKESLQWWC